MTDLDRTTSTSVWLLAALFCAVLAGWLVAATLHPEPAAAEQRAWSSDRVYLKLGVPGTARDDDAAEFRGGAEADEHPYPPSGVLYVVTDDGDVVIHLNGGGEIVEPVKAGDEVIECETYVQIRKQ